MKTGMRGFADAMVEILPGFIKEMARRQLSAAAKEGLTIQQIIALEYLTKKKQAIMSELARYMRVTLSAVTGLVERMIKAKLVTRNYDRNDRRIIIIRPTRKGRQIALDIKRRRHKFIMSTFSRISEGEREAYLKTLTKVYNILIGEKKR